MSIVVVGEALIDLIAQSDGSYKPHLGGSPYNLAIGLARQEVPVTYLAPFSNDVFGTQLEQALLQEGVDLPIKRRSQKPTSLAVVTVNEQGIPSYGFYRDGVADKDATAEEVSSLFPKDLKVLHTGSLAITPSQIPKVLKLFEVAHGLGAITSVDINIRIGASRPTQTYLDGIRNVLEHADIIKASDEDLEALGLRSEFIDVDPALKGLKENQMLVTTYGSDGAGLNCVQGHIKVEARRAGEMKDTVGAGDSFYAAFLSELHRSNSFEGRLSDVTLPVLQRALEAGATAAAINVARVGCNPPTRHDLERFLDS